MLKHESEECDTPAILNPGLMMKHSEEIEIKYQIWVVLAMQVFIGSFSYVVFMKLVFI